jgi:1-aminocyclopropane-1-carboxylate deaminase/D-cysteine desulfhydrase-like pyridoxal-dependent ACC family enzyme
LSIVCNNTCIEEYEGVLVKREDLSSPYPGPGFSKIRGVAAHIAKQKADTIGVLDTFHSKGGWAVSYVCASLGKKAVLYYPKYKHDTGLRIQQQEARVWGATLRPLPAGRSAILYHAAKKHLYAGYPGAYMMPNALKLGESVEESAREVVATITSAHVFSTLAISVSSGTIAAGVIRGLDQLGRYPELLLHLGYSRSHDAVRQYLEKASGVSLSKFKVDLVDEQYNYMDKTDAVVPFPCNPYYDAKLWDYLMRTGRAYAAPLLMWNIGA